MQALLDTLLTRADTAARARFIVLCRGQTSIILIRQTPIDTKAAAEGRPRPTQMHVVTGAA